MTIINIASEHRELMKNLRLRLDCDAMTDGSEWLSKHALEREGATGNSMFSSMIQLRHVSKCARPISAAVSV